jgi:hypothetical protein
MQNTLAARTHPDRTLRILARAVRGARGLKSRRGDGEALAAALLSDEVAAAGDAEPRRRARQREAV